MIKHMAKAHTNMQMELLILEIGSKTNSMVKALKPGRMVLGTKVAIRMAKKMATEY